MSAETNPDKSEREDELEKKLAEALTIGVPIATALLSVIAGVMVDVATAILVLAGGALVAVIAMFWGSLRTLLGETPLSGADAYALGAPPRAEEEQKRAVLRALKDLEFERSVGKISEEDYRALVAKYRAEAKRLLQLLDQEAAPGRERAEAMFKRRLQKEGLLETEAAEEADEPIDDEDEDKREDEPEAKADKPAEKKPVEAKPTAKKKKKKSAKKPAKTEQEDSDEDNEKDSDSDKKTVACPSCKTQNDEDASFCKKCGARLKTEDKNETENEEADET